MAKNTIVAISKEVYEKIGDLIILNKVKSYKSYVESLILLEWQKNKKSIDQIKALQISKKSENNVDIENEQG